jgi:spore germination cell wall hydrolase CwlJ-like protein
LVDGVYVKKLASNKILHYHATYVNPKWAKQGQMVASAGAHVFYKNVPY